MSLGIRGRKRSPMMCRRGKHTFIPAGSDEENVYEWCVVCGVLKREADTDGKVEIIKPDSQK